jgi:hypothetical protein
VSFYLLAPAAPFAMAAYFIVTAVLDHQRQMAEMDLCIHDPEAATRLPGLAAWEAAAHGRRATEAVAEAAGEMKSAMRSVIPSARAPDG